MNKVFLKISQNLHEITYTSVSFSLGLSSVISKVFFADFEDEKQMLLFEYLKDLSQETIIYSKLATEILKHDVKSVKS